MQSTIEKIKNWFDLEAKNDNCFYKLYTVKFVNSSYGRKDLRSTNFHTETKEECINKLINDINIHGATANKFFVINHFEGKRDPHPITLIVENPHFVPDTQKYSTINGIHNYQNSNNEMLSLMREHNDQASRLREELIQMKHQHEIEKMDSRIAELETGQKTVVDSITDFMQSEVGQKIVSSFTTLMSIKMQQKSEPSVTNTQKDLSHQEYQETKQQQQTTDNTDKIDKLNNSLQKLDNVFNGEGLEALNELAQFCVENPSIAQQFRKQQANEQ